MSKGVYMSFGNDTETKLKFTTTMKLFIEDIQATFPEFKDILTPLLVDINNKDMTSKYINKLINDSIKIYTPAFHYISNKQENIFYDTNIDSHFIPNIDFKNLWGLDITDNIKESIWEYLRLISLSVMRMGYKPPNIMESSNSVINPPFDKPTEKTRRTIKQSIHFNTKFRENFSTTSSSDFVITLPIECTNVISLSLSSISIPNIIYTFSKAKRNNTFTIVDDNDKSHTIIIPYGIYSMNNLITYLENTYFGGDDALFPKLKFHVNKHSLKSYFVSTDSGGSSTTIKKIIFAKNEKEFLQSAGYILGYRKLEYNSNDFIQDAKFLDIGNGERNGINYEYINLPPEGLDGGEIDIHWKNEKTLEIDSTPFLVSESTYNASGDYFIYLALDDFVQSSQPSNIVFFKDSIMKSDVLAKIYLGQGLYLTNIDTDVDDGDNQSKTRIYPGPVNINKIHLTLLDEMGNIIDLNGADVPFSFEITRII